MKKILIILDGAADLPNKILKDKTPLEAANTPHLDFLAKNGQLGLMYPLNKKTIPSSANSLVALFGNDPKKCQRGTYEAIGAGFNLKRGDLALRTNFATIDNLKSKKLIDRRAGRTLTTKEAHQLAESLNKEISLPCKFEFKSTIQHRGVLVLKGGHSDNISSVNSGWAGNDKANQFKFSEPLDNDPDSKYSSNLVNKFIHQSYQILNNHPINKIRIKKGLFPANIILTRGAGSELPKIKSYKSWMSINSMPLEVGIAKLSKMKNFPYNMPEQSSIDIYDHLYKLLNKKIKHSIKTLKRNHKDFIGCYIQIKETDIPGHDNKPLEKKKMIELIDKKFFSFIKKAAIKHEWKVIVTCDHSTPCELKGHSSHPVPVLVYDPAESTSDHAHRFNEIEARIGSLKTFLGKDFVEKVGLNR
jgi:2,3-bisphosphoglycerate-independent phosphoglycerate mutase